MCNKNLFQIFPYSDENEPHQGDGRYKFRYVTGNGITAQEEGYLNNPQAQWPDCQSPNCPEQVAIGSYSYTAPDGQLISISYKADANGFQPEGAHLPTPPPLPAEYYEWVLSEMDEFRAGSDSLFFFNYRQVELQRKIAAEVEAEGQRILALQAQLGQQNQYQQQGQHSQQSYNYNAQASNNVYRQQPAHPGYNNNAQPAAKPQQNYLPPQQYGKKWA